MRFSFVFLLVCALVLFAAPCYGGGNQSAQTGENPAPGNDQRLPPRSSIEFIGVSPKMSSREEAIQCALEDAARRLSFFYSVGGTFTISDYIGRTALEQGDFSSEYQLYYDGELTNFLEELQFDPATDVFESYNALFVKARVMSDVSMPLSRGHSLARERPEWVDKPPKYDGFFVGVGVAGKMEYLSTTIIESYENAVITLIANIHSNVRGELLDIESNTTWGIDVTSRGEISSSGTLKNFYIIESWTDPVTQSVHTLAVAKSGF